MLLKKMYLKRIKIVSLLFRVSQTENQTRKKSPCFRHIPEILEKLNKSHNLFLNEFLCRGVD